MKFEQAPWPRRISQDELSSAAPRSRPQPRDFQGRDIRLEPLDPDRHATELYEQLR